MNRGSSVDRFLSTDKRYLINSNPNIWLVSICEKNISFGNVIYLRKNSIIIMIALFEKNYVVSISNFDEKNIEEIYFRLTKELDGEFWNDIPKEYRSLVDLNIKYLNQRLGYNSNKKRREVK